MRAQVRDVSRFLCDEMLHGLGRWLRAAGYDTVIVAGGLSDRVRATCCAEEDRVLLTKDRHLATTVNDDVPVYCFRKAASTKPHEPCASLLTSTGSAPFTRCLVDNRALEAAPPHLVNQVPKRSRATGGPLQVCPNAVAFIGREVMSAECSSGLLPGKARRPRLVSRVGLLAPHLKGRSESTFGRLVTAA